VAEKKRIEELIWAGGATTMAKGKRREGRGWENGRRSVVEWIESDGG
jgi:hypothetical protein